MFRIEEFRRQMANSRSQENSLGSGDTITTRTDHPFYQQNRNYTQSYLDGTLYSNEKKVDSFNASRSDGLKSQYIKNTELRIEGRYFFRFN